MSAKKNDNQVVVTREGYERLSAELVDLRTVRRLEVARQLEEARAFGKDCPECKKLALAISRACGRGRDRCRDTASIAYARRFQSIPHILYPIPAPSFCSQRKGKSVNIPPRQI